MAHSVRSLLRYLLLVDKASILILFVIAGAVLLFLFDSAPAEGQASSAREFYKRATCEQPHPRAVQAWGGCWKAGPARKPPTEENLFLRFRFTEQTVKMWPRGENPSVAMSFDFPRYCMVDDRPTLAPERNADGLYARVLVMHNEPPYEWEKTMQDSYRQPHKGTSWAEFQQIVSEFMRKGGKYVWTWLVTAPDQVWWDNDAEEDMWIIRVACDELER